ncbi:MAG: Fe2+-dependent dioxygenase [Gammaproteobacteria bacterium]|nr:Fe2+-dependent dioxygenase [Gammaproteobacteria bacterium]
MLLHLPGVLSPEELEKIREGLRQGVFADGRASAGRLAGEVKQNEEFQAPRSEREPLELCVAQALQRHPMVQSHALPLRISHPIFSRYQPGMHYGWHTDDAVMGEGGYRSDLAVTVFLSDPSEYEGGALVVETPYGEQAARYPAGDAVLYPAGHLHRVDEVTSGERWVAVLWIQSQVRDEQQREVLQTLDALRSQRMEKDPADDELARLDWVYSRLLRMWADV